MRKIFSRFKVTSLVRLVRPISKSQVRTSIFYTLLCRIESRCGNVYIQMQSTIHFYAYSHSTVLWSMSSSSFSGGFILHWVIAVLHSSVHIFNSFHHFLYFTPIFSLFTHPRTSLCVHTVYVVRITYLSAQ